VRAKRGDECSVWNTCAEFTYERCEERMVVETRKRKVYCHKLVKAEASEERTCTNPASPSNVGRATRFSTVIDQRARVRSAQQSQTGLVAVELQCGRLSQLSVPESAWR
jgi:hypothetical protein